MAIVWCSHVVRNMELKWKMLAWYTLFGSSQGSFRRMRRVTMLWPKFIWHTDGYNIGLCISGCICELSLKIIWVNVYQTNNYQKLIGSHFLETAVTANSGCPSKNKDRLRNMKRRCMLSAFQTFLRRNNPDDDRQYMYGTSTRNQRTESWWGIMQFWTELFKHLLNKTAGVSLENFWTGILYCSVSYQ